MASGRRLQLAAVLLFFIAYSVLSHYSNLNPQGHDLRTLLALAPMLTLGLVLLWRWSGALIALLAAAAAAVLVACLLAAVRAKFFHCVPDPAGWFLFHHGLHFRPIAAQRPRPAVHAARGQSSRSIECARTALHAKRHARVGHVLFTQSRCDLPPVQVRPAAHLVGVREFLLAAADSADVRGGIRGPPPRAAAGTAQRIDCHLARIFREFASKTDGHDRAAVAYLTHGDCRLSIGASP